MVKLVTFVLLSLAATAYSKSLRRRDESSLFCLVVEVHERNLGSDEDHLECELFLDNGEMLHGLNIELPENVVDTNSDALRRGEWYVKLPGARVNTTYVEGYGSVPSSIILARDPMIITVPGGELQSSDRRLNNRNRHLGRRTQTRTLLVIRVSTLDKAPTYTANQLQSYYFDSKNYSVIRQYGWCSANWLRFKATAVTNPVLDVVVPARLSSFTKELLWATAWNVTMKQYNVTYSSSLAQHVAFVLPPGLNGGKWVATGTVGYWRTIYNDIYGGYPNVAMHELGHNLGMGHAGMGGNQYADTTDIMGYGDMQQFGPSRCFNGLHFWFLNWFTDRKVEVSPWNLTRTNLASFVDYSRTNSSQVVMIKVDDYYLVYNRAKGVNDGTEEAKNQVTVVQALNGVMSTRLAALDNTTAPFVVPNYGGGSMALTIQVCSMAVTSSRIDYAIVSIGVGANCLSK